MFDPLHKWLGIPPHEQPPHHYRLLGIAVFEEDTDVIDVAADKQLAFLRDLTNGEYAEQAEQLSNRVSAARDCLLHKAKKQAYDNALRSQLERSLPAATPPPVLGPPKIGEVARVEMPASPLNVEPARELPAAVQADAIGASQPVRVSERRDPRRSKSSLSRYRRYSTLLCIFSLVLVAVLIQQGRLELDLSVLETLGLVQSPEPVPIPQPTDDPPPPRETEPEPPATHPSEEPVAVTEPPQQPATPAQSPPDRSPTQDPIPRPPRSLSDLLHPGTSSDVSEPVVKSPLPAKGQLDEKMQLIRELYEEEYRKAKTSQEKIELAREMHREGQETSDDPIGRFALWRVARDIMTLEGNFISALGIVANLDTHYSDVDACQMRVETLQESTRRITKPQFAEFLDASAGVVARCDIDERFDLADSLFESVSQELGAQLTESQRSALESMEAKSQFVEDAYKRYQVAAQTLKESANNPEANQIAGHYLCFIRGDWQAGIDYLRRGSDATMRNAAELESNGHSTASQAIAIADRWYDIAKSESEAHAQETIYHHALDWYLTAQESAEGLEGKKVDARIASLERLLPSTTEDADPLGTSSSASKLLGHRLLTSAESRRDFAERKKGNEFTIGMGSRPDGIGEAQAGVELQGVDKLTVVGSASHKDMPNVDSYTKSGFVIDYHTPGGYAKRVFLGLGLHPGREFSEAPPWGTARQPDAITDIGRSNTYNIDLTRWAPSTWDGRCWFTIYMQNGGTDRSLKATLSW